MKKYLFFIFLVMAAGSVRAQFPFPGQKQEKNNDGDRLDSLLALLRNKKIAKIRPYGSVITKDAVTHQGLFTVHEVRDSFFLEIPDTLLNRHLQLIKRLVKGSIPELFGLLKKYPGEELESKTVYFAMAPDSSINLYNDIVASQADPGSRIAAAVKNANADAVLQTFTIVAKGKDDAGYVVDITGFLKGSSALSSVNKDPGKAYHVEYVHAYPINVEFGVYRTYGVEQTPLVTNTSLIILPQIPMRQRILDRRVGYFADNVSYFADDQHKVEKREFILRWRLEPRPEDMDRWKRGELVEPARPIVIYIDPNTPKQWVKYLILGVNDWQKAFEQAGFKNAIMGKEWPQGDSANLDDARYSFICYLPSATANAYGPNTHDLRSGEIIQTHIGWYHNVMSLVHDWYMIQAGATDPRARKPKFDDDLMGQLIRFVSSHEVGHTLGLRHNFGSSSQTPVEKLRDKEWLKVHGHTASIMDYARFNYVAQPEDNIPEESLWPHIGEYDRWAIEWGYKYSGAATVEEDKKITGRWATEKLAANPRLWYGSMEGENKDNARWTIDPRAQSEDLGDNNMTASAYGIKNLKRILPNLPAWCHETNGQYGNLETAYNSLTEQFRQYMAHVMTNVGGVERTYKSEEMTGDVYAPVPKAMQQQALAFFNEELFTTPTWLLNPAVTNKVAVPADPDFVGDLQIRVLNSLLDSARFASLASLSARFGAASCLSQSEYLSTLHKYIWGGLATGQPMDVYRRNLQKTYIGNLADIVLSISPAIAETEVYSLARTDLVRLQKELETALPKYTTMNDRAHLESQVAVIRKIMNVKPD